MSESESAGIEGRTISEVRDSTRFLLESFKAKMTSLRECGPEVKALLRFGVDFPSASSTAKRFFGSNQVRYIAIDGTDAIDQRLDLIVFYIGAFAYSGTVSFAPDGVEVGGPEAEKTSLSVSAAIPLSEEDAAQVFGQRRESGIEVEAERLPMSLMHLAEYYLAHKAAASESPKRILILDRTLAGDVAHLVWSTREFIRSGFCVLQGMETPSGKVTPFDLELVRMVASNPQLRIPEPRSQLLKFAAVLELLKGESLSADELIAAIGADPKWTDRLVADLADLDGQYHIFESSYPQYSLKPEVAFYWDRVLSAAENAANHIFNPMGGHPLRVKKGQGESWVTADDLDFLVLVFIRAITQKAWTDNILPIGFVKDSNAFEMVKAAVPVLERAHLLDGKEPFPNFNSDKMLLQTNSVVNSQDVPTPWHSFEMDAAFRTMAPVDGGDLGRGRARVNGAYENVIYPERVYAKTYIQLWSSRSAPSVRSHVFTYDRPVYPGYDHWDELLLLNKDGPVDWELRPVLHFERSSELTNMVMAVLTEMAQEVIPEALGHNYPLFLADKKAKSVLSETKEAYLGAVDIEMAKSDLDQQVLFSRRFRDYRSQIEGKRKN